MSSAGAPSTTTRSVPGRSWAGWSGASCSIRAGSRCITVLLAVGLVFAVDPGQDGASLHGRDLGLGLVSLLLFFGRPTLGPVLDLLPGGRRPVPSPVHQRGAPGGALPRRHRGGLPRDPGPRTRPASEASPVPDRGRRDRVAALPAARARAVLERVGYERQGGAWIDEQAQQQATDGVGLRGAGRACADARAGAGSSPRLAGPRGPAYRIGQVPAFAALLNLQADAVGFTRPTWSLMSPCRVPVQIDNESHPGVVRRPVRDPTGRRGRGHRRRAGRPSGGTSCGSSPTSATSTSSTRSRPSRPIARTSGRRCRPSWARVFPAAGSCPRWRSVDDRPRCRRWAAMPCRRDSPGQVVESYARIRRGGVRGNGPSRTRPGVVLVKASYDPRWTHASTATRCRRRCSRPAMVGDPVPRGRARGRRWSTSPTRGTSPLFVLGGASILASVVLGAQPCSLAVGRPPRTLPDVR